MKTIIFSTRKLIHEYFFQRNALKTLFHCINNTFCLTNKYFQNNILKCFWLLLTIINNIINNNKKVRKTHKFGVVLHNYQTFIKLITNFKTLLKINLSQQTFNLKATANKFDISGLKQIYINSMFSISIIILCRIFCLE